ncbi:hypothetical protein H5410_043892 [Solanum commersonii]|uniref:Uncharacterized protein n=1 Tax=Solanum commersonii TaxID=4109 RepID=A0A9J5Y074_SOLCO|nr:hypothetical protein H5410_043892 [Solanum commersonii]
MDQHMPVKKVRRNVDPPKRLPSNPMRHQKVPLFLKGKFIYKSIKHVVQFINEWKIVTRRKGEGADEDHTLNHWATKDITSVVIGMNGSGIKAGHVGSSKRQNKIQESKAMVPMTTKGNGAKELKSLEPAEFVKKGSHGSGAYKVKVDVTSITRNKGTHFQGMTSRRGYIKMKNLKYFPVDSIVSEKKG